MCSYCSEFRLNKTQGAVDLMAVMEAVKPCRLFIKCGDKDAAVLREFFAFEQIPPYTAVWVWEGLIFCILSEMGVVGVPKGSSGSTIDRFIRSHLAPQRSGPSNPIDTSQFPNLTTAEGVIQNKPVENLVIFNNTAQQAIAAFSGGKHSVLQGHSFEIWVHIYA